MSAFYAAVFGCRAKSPNRNHSGDWLERGTGLRNAALEGVHLLLPGYGDNGPTLEVYTYSETVEQIQGPANRQGLAHIAFEVDDVHAVAKRLLDRGGTLVGQITEHLVEGAGVITFVYARDPEGNIIELQSWRKEEAQQCAQPDREDVAGQRRVLHQTRKRYHDQM